MLLLSIISRRLSLCVICLTLLVALLSRCYWQAFTRICRLPTVPSPTQVNESFYDHFHYRTIDTCTDDRSNIFLTIAVLSSFERLAIYLPSIINTWALTTTKEIEIILFIEENTWEDDPLIEQIFDQVNFHRHIHACFYLVRLKHVENDYPPQKKSFYAMKYLYTFYRQRTQWLLRLDDNAYVNIEKLLHWLKSIDHRQTLYIGQGGSGRRNGPAIHFPPGRYFCMGGSGIILSQPTLIELGPWLDQCLNAETITKHEDVELGRCILSHLNISCTSAYDSKSLFYHHYGPGYSFGYDFTISIISQALILHPMKDPNTFHQLFAFYLQQKQPPRISNSPSIARIDRNYVTFLSKIEFDLVRDVHYQTIDARWRAYIKERVAMYTDKLRLFWHKRAAQWTLTDSSFFFGYHRVIPTDRLELMVEIELHARPQNRSSREAATARKRMYIRQRFSSIHPFHYREILLNKINSIMSQLNVVVVACNKDGPLKRFVENFQREVLDHPTRHQLISLTIVYFPFHYRTNYELIHYIGQLSVRYDSQIRLSVIEQKNITYNRGLGRHLASELFTSEQILLFLDVDLGFTGQALDNMRRLMIHQLSVSNCTVYFPIIFSSFSHLFTNDEKLISRIDKNHGLFSIYGFGNVAVRKRDLDRIGGWETDNHDWGDEDVNLFQRFNQLSTECNIFRAVEPGFRHFYHKKMCSGIKNEGRRKTCRDAEMNIFGPQAQMTTYVINHKLINH